jgi:hypothetical protein
VHATNKLVWLPGAKREGREEMSAKGDRLAAMTSEKSGDLRAEQGL